MVQYKVKDLGFYPLDTKACRAEYPLRLGDKVGKKGGRREANYHQVRGDSGYRGGKK